MSTRKTKVFSFTVSSGVFKTYDEAVKEANAIKIWLQRLCERKGYSCKAVIGVSNHNPQTGQKSALKTGRRGRPKLVFERDASRMKPTETAPHLHLILYANPGDMICSLLAKRLNHKYKRKSIWYKNCATYITEAVEYVFKQCLKLRTIEVDEEGTLLNDEIGFYQAVEASTDKYESPIISFTHSMEAQATSTVEVKSVQEDFKAAESIHCNSSSLIDKYIHSMHNSYTYLIYTPKRIRDWIHIYMNMICAYTQIEGNPP